MNKPTAVVFFSGGGGVEAGLKDAGIEPVAAVEFNPELPKLSHAMSDTHELNFPGCKVFRETVQAMQDDNYSRLPKNPDILWASPMCSHFSNAQHYSEESVTDTTSAIAINGAIRVLKPKHFLLENVRGYRKSDSFRMICDHLTLEGYKIEHNIVNMANYGVPQARRRLILRASRDIPLALPRKQPHVGWYDVLGDLIPGLPDSELVSGQKLAVKKWKERKAPVPLYIERIGGRGEYKAVPGNKPVLTVLRSHFTDQRQNSRNHFADIWLPNGTVKQVTIECVKRLQGFPAWYKLPEKTAVAGSILGYSVPPLFVKKLTQPLTMSQSKQSLDVMTSTGNNEAYTPDKVIEAALTVMGEIDLDPCSNSMENPNIPAHQHYTKELDGLSHPWTGRIYLNPPYSETAKWIDKLLYEYQMGHVSEAIVLIKSATDTKWYKSLYNFPFCHIDGRLKFKPNASPAPFASTVFYLGSQARAFERTFKSLGRVHGILGYSPIKGIKRKLENYQVYLEAGLAPVGSVEYIERRIASATPEELEWLQSAIAKRMVK